MKYRKITTIFLLITLIIIVSYSYHTKKELQLIITEYTQNEYEESPKVVKKIKVKKGTIINSKNKDIKLKIDKVRKSSIIIKTNQPMSLRKNKNDTIDLTSQRNMFTLKKGNTVILTTPTPDSGENYKLELK